MMPEYTIAPSGLATGDNSLSLPFTPMHYLGFHLIGDQVNRIKMKGSLFILEAFGDNRTPTGAPLLDLVGLMPYAVVIAVLLKMDS